MLAEQKHENKAEDHILLGLFFLILMCQCTLIEQDIFYVPGYE